MHNLFTKYSEVIKVVIGRGDTVSIRPIPFDAYMRIHGMPNKSEEDKFPFNCAIIAAMVVDDDGVPMLSADEVARLDATVFVELLDHCTTHAMIGQVEQKKSTSTTTTPLDASTDSVEASANPSNQS